MFGKVNFWKERKTTFSPFSVSTAQDCWVGIGSDLTHLFAKEAICTYEYQICTFKYGKWAHKYRHAIVQKFIY